MSIVRVNSWELPLSAITLYQLLPCHLGPPMLSINLYVTGRWSIPHVHISKAFSPQCQAVQVAHWTWWWQCLVVWHCRFVWSLPYHSAEDVGRFCFVNGQVSLAWSIVLDTQELYTQPYVLKRGSGKTELVAAPSTSSRQFHTCYGWKFTATSCWEHVP